MTAQAPDPFVPRGVLLGIGSLLAVAILGAGLTRSQGPAGGVGEPAATILESRSLRFADRKDGAVTVTDASDGSDVAVLPPGGDGFIRGTLRGLNRERVRRGLGDEVPLTLALQADGRLLLSDPATDRIIELGAFGHTNKAAFARLLTTQTGGTP